jgi:hypothetical protein
MPPFSIRGTDAVRYMSVHTGVQAAHRTDSHGHCPQNRLTCANQQVEPLPQAHPVRAMCAEARPTNHSPAAITPIPRMPGLRSVIPAQVTTMIAATGRRCWLQRPAKKSLKTRHGPGTIRRHPIPAHRKQMARRVTCQASTAADLPTELVTLIDLPCTPEVPSIHLPWTCAATGPAPAAHADSSDYGLMAGLPRIGPVSEYAGAMNSFIPASWFARPRLLDRASSAGPPRCSRSPAWRRLLPGRAERAGRAR